MKKKILIGIVAVFVLLLVAFGAFYVGLNAEKLGIINTKTKTLIKDLQFDNNTCELIANLSNDTRKIVTNVKGFGITMEDCQPDFHFDSNENHVVYNRSGGSPDMDIHLVDLDANRDVILMPVGTSIVQYLQFLNEKYLIIVLSSDSKYAQGIYGIVVYDYSNVWYSYPDNLSPNDDAILDSVYKKWIKVSTLEKSFTGDLTLIKLNGSKLEFYTDISGSNPSIAVDFKTVKPN